MYFKASNFTVTWLLLLAFTVFTMLWRQKKPLDNPVPFLYWLTVVFFTVVRPEETYNLSFLLPGLAAGMMLRFEFLNSFFIKVVRGIEYIVWAYVLYRGVEELFMP